MPSVVSIGNFDGVHLGHQRIIARAAELARRTDQPTALTVTALTFEPHPAATLRPGHEPPRLMTAEQKSIALKAAGADRVIEIEPTHQTLRLDPADFVRQLAEQHHPAVVVEGADFRFGRNRAGDCATLMQLAAALPPDLRFDTEVVGQVSVTLHDQLNTPVSSSLIRGLLAHGRVADAARCLGKAFCLTAPIARGEARGRDLGFPTANLNPASLIAMMVPAEGVYAGHAVLPDGSAHTAAISIGHKPTFSQNALCIEAHLLDFNADLYDQPVTLHFARWVRDQIPFPGIAELTDQIKRDVDLTRQWDAAGLLSPSTINTPTAAAG